MEKSELVLHNSENQFVSLVSSTWARVIDVMDSEVQDYLVSLGLVLR